MTFISDHRWNKYHLTFMLFESHSLGQLCDIKFEWHGSPLHGTLIPGLTRLQCASFINLCQCIISFLKL